MTSPYEMPDDPGSPDQTDSEISYPDRAERAAEESEARQDQAEGNPDPDAFDEDSDK